MYTRSVVVSRSPHLALSSLVSYDTTTEQDTCIRQIDAYREFRLVELLKISPVLLFFPFISSLPLGFCVLLLVSTSLSIFLLPHASSYRCLLSASSPLYPSPNIGRESCSYTRQCLACLLATCSRPSAALRLLEVRSEGRENFPPRLEVQPASFSSFCLIY